MAETETRECYTCGHINDIENDTCDSCYTPLRHPYSPRSKPKETESFVMVKAPEGYWKIILKPQLYKLVAANN